MDTFMCGINNLSPILVYGFLVAVFGYFFPLFIGQIKHDNNSSMLDLKVWWYGFKRLYTIILSILIFIWLVGFIVC